MAQEAIMIAYCIPVATQLQQGGDELVCFTGRFGIMAMVGFLIKKRHWIDLLQHKVHTHVSACLCL